MLDYELEARVFENALNLLKVLDKYSREDKEKIINRLEYLSKCRGQNFERLVYSKAFILLRDINEAITNF